MFLANDSYKDGVAWATKKILWSWFLWSLVNRVEQLQKKSNRNWFPKAKEQGQKHGYTTMVLVVYIVVRLYLCTSQSLLSPHPHQERVS